MRLYSSTEMTMDIRSTTVMARMERIIFILRDRRNSFHRFLSFTNISTKIHIFQKSSLIKIFYCKPLFFNIFFISLRWRKIFLT